MITKAEKMKVQYKKKVKRIADVKAIGLVLDNKGQTVNLYEKRPFPLMVEKNGNMVVAVTTALPGIQVEDEVNRDMQLKTSLPLRMRNTSCKKKENVMQIP